MTRVAGYAAAVPERAGVCNGPEPRMSWIAEHTPERLVVRLGALFPHSAICVFD